MNNNFFTPRFLQTNYYTTRACKFEFHSGSNTSDFTRKPRRPKVFADHAAPSNASSAANHVPSAAATSRAMAANRVFAAVTSAARPGA